MTNGRDLGLIALKNSTKQDLSGWCQYFVGLMISASLGKPAPGGYNNAELARKASNLEYKTAAEVPIGGILYFDFPPKGHDAVKIGSDLMIHASANKSGLVESLGRGVKITRISEYNRKFIGGSKANGTRPRIEGIQPYELTPSAPTLGLDAVAREVLSGKWGNGSDREKRLVAAGYSYSDVQAKVNAILRGETPRPDKTVDAIAREVLQGLWGNGSDRERRIREAGYDYGSVQNRVNEIIAASSPPTPSRRYTVRRGDNLSKIASSFGVQGGWKRLYEANKHVIGSNPNVIKPGTVLTLP